MFVGVHLVKQRVCQANRDDNQDAAKRQPVKKLVKDNDPNQRATGDFEIACRGKLCRRGQLGRPDHGK